MPPEDQLSGVFGAPCRPVDNARHPDVMASSAASSGLGPHLPGRRSKCSTTSASDTAAFHSTSTAAKSMRYTSLPLGTARFCLLLV